MLFRLNIYDTDRMIRWSQIVRRRHECHLVTILSRNEMHGNSCNLQVIYSIKTGREYLLHALQVLFLKVRFYTASYVVD